MRSAASGSISRNSSWFISTIPLDKHLFAKDKRAFSHGCTARVQNPLTYGDKLLSLVMPKERYTEARLEFMFRRQRDQHQIPEFFYSVHLTYQTAFVDEAGKLQAARRCLIRP